jgi:hypothetical protein
VQEIVGRYHTGGNAVLAGELDGRPLDRRQRDDTSADRLDLRAPVQVDTRYFATDTRRQGDTRRGRDAK